MCFDINPKSKKERTLWQATENIVCYKLVTRINENLYGYYYNNFRYIKGKLLNSKLLIPKNGNFLTRTDTMFFEIEEGFHSNKEIKNCNRAMWDENEYSHPIAEFIIPKGALFYENNYQYVSNKIILVKTLE